MGNYLNPGRTGFEEILGGRYIDKTGLIEIIDKRVNKPDKLVCVSRPRRFGKSYAAKMLSAYYDCSCDSRELFANLKIGELECFPENLNSFNVVVLDIAAIISRVKRKKKGVNRIVEEISEGIRRDIITEEPSLQAVEDVTDCIEKYAEITGRKFVFIIDEWDAVIREAKDDDKTQEAYLDLLREWFKNANFTPKYVAAAYMTGILPIKKDGSQSAISDFKEYTILDPGPFTEYTGFTEEETGYLCKENNIDFSLVKQWFDGYEFDKIGSIYNPYSVMETIESGVLESHWQKTSVAENLITYINMDMNGLQADIIKLLSNEPVKVNTRSFKNDFESFVTKDDVLTILIHLGYLSYDKKTEKARIPNREVKQEFEDILRHPEHTRLFNLIKTSEKLLEDTLAGNEEAVALTIEKIRETNYAPRYYNNEQALRYAVKFAYIVCVDRFLKIEEMPSGRGLADIVFIPDINTAYPVIIIELKWDKDAEDGLDQINEKRYDAVLSGFSGEVVKVAINYDTNSKIHNCRIERRKI